MSVLARVREANAPKPPEGSIPLRVACVVAVAVGLGAAASEGELSWAAAIGAALLVAAGMAFSHRTRERAHGWVKLAVAVGALGAAAEFLNRLYAAAGSGLAGVEPALTVLLASILVVHSFHVPARRDLLFALAGSAALIAVAAAAAVDMTFGAYALGWAAVAFWALVECGAAATGGSRPGGRLVVTAAATAAGVGLVAFLVLPAPTADVSLDFRTNAGTAGLEPSPGALAGDSGRPTELSRPGSPTGATKVGGFLGFAGDLDTAVRAGLGHQVVMEVRASVPSFWVGETYNDWNGQSWSSTLGKSSEFENGSPFELADTPSAPGTDPVTDIQTFYVESGTADLAFHADQAEELWFPAPEVFVGPDGSIVSPVALGKGAIYTVESMVTQPTATELETAGTDPYFPASLAATDTELPEAYSQVRQLVGQVTAGESNEYAEVESLINWIGGHTRYSTDIPPLPRGADAVDNFLFGSRVGYCEQISTALAVMLRTLGIPAREAVGYVPGPYNPVTDVYEVEADDAHAWVQVWFPGYGWVDFDPTAVVPDANPAPGMVALRDVGRFLGALPLATLAASGGGLIVAAALVAAVAIRRRAAAVTPAERAVARMERAGRRAGRARAPAETVGEYARALDGGWPEVARAVEASAYGALDVPAEEWRRLLVDAAGRPGRP